MTAARIPLRFGIIGENERFPAWAAACIRHLLASGHAELVLFIRKPGGPGPSQRPRHELLYRLYEAKWLKRRSRALKSVDLGGELGHLPEVSLPPSQAGSSLGADVIEEIRGYRLDFLLSLGSQPPRGEILSVPRFGVWSYAHDRDPAPCFWELLSDNGRTRASLDRIGAAPADDVGLHRGFFGTCRASWVNNLDRALFGSADFCSRVCAELSAEQAEPSRGTASGPSHGTTHALESPDNRALVRLMLATGSSTLAKLWELLFHVEVWNVGFNQQSVEQLVRAARVDPSGVSWCTPHEPDHFIADPFAYSYAGEQIVLVEDYVQGKGRICRLAGPPGGARLELAVDFEFPYHMSYPCTFAEDGEVYCIPETYQFGRAGLYKRTQQGWALVRTLLEGQPVVDPTLFRYGGLYWVIFTLQNDGAWGNLKLYAYYAERLDAEWKPHLLNPIKCDIGSTRPAGSPAWIDGQLYRPSQDCSRTYGGAVVMNRIVKLSPTEFEEVEAVRIEPMRAGPYPHGLHTINPMGSQSVIDSKKFAFDALAWRKNWGRLHEVFT